VEILWIAHNRWAKENGNMAYSKRKFIVEIKGACNGTKRDRKRLELSHLSRYYKWDRGVWIYTKLTATGPMLRADRRWAGRDFMKSFSVRFRNANVPNFVIETLEQTRSGFFKISNCRRSAATDDISKWNNGTRNHSLEQVNS
jgi:hypothetical protein